MEAKKLIKDLDLDKTKELENELAFKKYLANKVNKYFEKYEGKINLPDEKAMKLICPSLYKYGYDPHQGYFVFVEGMYRVDEPIEHKLFPGFPVNTLSEAFNILLLSYFVNQSSFYNYYNIYNRNSLLKSFNAKQLDIPYNYEVINYENIYKKLIIINDGNVPDIIQKTILERINSQYSDIEWYFDENNNINYKPIQLTHKKRLDF